MFLQTARAIDDWRRDIQIRRFALIALALAACLQTGCAARRLPISPPAKPLPPLESPQDAVQLLIEKYGGADSFRASGKIRMKLPGEQVQRQASFALMLERPDRLRMRVYRPLAPTLLEIVSDGNRRWLYVPSERTAYLSEGRQPLRVEGNHVALPADTIAAALVVVADPHALPLLPSRIRIGEGFIRLSVTEEDGTQREIRIDSASGLATRQILVGADGATQADITYKEHAFKENTAVAISTDILLPQIGAFVSIRIDKLETGAQIPAGAFEFSPPAGVKIMRP